MPEFRKPDLTAPRLRKSWSSIDLPKLIKSLKKKYPGKYDTLDISFLKKVITTHHQNLQEDIIDNPDGIELPEMMGIIKIVSCPSAKKENVNFQASKKSGKVVIHTNNHTNGMLGKIYYSNLDRRYYVKDRKLWRFKPVRQFSRLVSKEYPLDWEKYQTLHNLDKIGYKMKIKAQKKKHIELLDYNRDIRTYNEFKID